MWKTYLIACCWQNLIKISICERDIPLIHQFLLAGNLVKIVIWHLQGLLIVHHHRHLRLKSIKSRLRLNVTRFLIPSWSAWTCKRLLGCVSESTNDTRGLNCASLESIRSCNYVTGCETRWSGSKTLSDTWSLIATGTSRPDVPSVSPWSRLSKSRGTTTLQASRSIPFLGAWLAYYAWASKSWWLDNSLISWLYSWLLIVIVVFPFRCCVHLAC